MNCMAGALVSESSNSATFGQACWIRAAASSESGWEAGRDALSMRAARVALAAVATTSTAASDASTGLRRGRSGLIHLMGASPQTDGDLMSRAAVTDSGTDS